jgi:ABC-2 type transport system permease protein
MPLFFLSGSIFPINSAPVILQWVARFDPLSYGIDAMRALLINASSFGLLLDFAVLVAFTALFLGLGSYFFSKIQA